MPDVGTWLAAKSSGQPPSPNPAVNRPPESRSTDAICLARSTGLPREPTFRTVVNSSTCSVRAAAASTVNGSRLS
jgi:hypothetical protein